MFYALFWFMESFIEIYVFQFDTSLINNLFFLEVHEIWMRLLIFSFFIFIGMFAQNIIGKRKKAEEIVKNEINKLKEIDLIKNELIRRISHELKTPLISIYSTANFLIENYKKKMDEKVLDYVKIINNGGERLKSLVDNLLDIYLIESEELKLELQTANLVNVIKQSIDNVDYLRSHRNHTLKIDLPNELFMEIDVNRINQVFTNILSNSLKYTPPEGEIFVSLEENGNYIDIKFQDTGIGITEEEQKRLYQKFGKIERFGQGMDVDSEGPGLGLFISNEIIRLHNGKILLKSEGRNKGCIFNVRLNKPN